MFFKLKSYFYFLLKSTNKHGVHSLFVYNLVTKCFQKKTAKESFNLFLHYKNYLLDNKKSVKVTDFGAGSKIFTSNTRQIAKIAKIAGISNTKATILIRLIDYFKPSNILEIGTSLGLGTTALFIGNLTSKITTLEGCPETAKIAQQQFNLFKFKTIDVMIGDFKKTLPKSTKNKQFDCVYFDGNHQKEPTLSYFETCLKTIHNDSFFIFDDIHWSKEMEETWHIIKQHPKVTVTVDIYHWGIVFFRKEQEKEHFTIRI